MTIMRFVKLSLGAVMVIAAAPNDVLTGVWGDRRATLTLDATGGQLVEDCQTATLTGPARQTGDGRFVATARRELHHGGPQRADVAPTFIDVGLTGQVTADGMTLEIRPSGGPPEQLILSVGRRTKGLHCS